MSEHSEFLCFIHMEKCGGSTLHRILTDNFPHYLALSSKNKVRGKFSEDHLKKLIDVYPFQLEGIGGHTVHPYFDYERAVGDRKIFYLTFLREPVSRYLSHLNHQINTKGIDWTVEGFMNESKFSNFQVKKIAGEEDLELAKQILAEKVDFTGLVERFDEGLVLLHNMIGGLTKLNYEKANVHAEKEVRRDYAFEELPDETKRKIIERNKLDIELYEFVKQELYPSLKQTYGENLQEQLKKLKASNRDYRYSALFELKFKVKHAMIRNGFQRLAMR